MIIYKYQCGSCREEYEFLQDDSNNHPHLCPECVVPLVQLAPRTGVPKSSGWYVTDYKNGGRGWKHKEPDHLAWHEQDINPIPKNSRS
jgi:putative FmdB family regulatory protein